MNRLLVIKGTHRPTVFTKGNTLSVIDHIFGCDVCVLLFVEFYGGEGNVFFLGILKCLIE